MVPTLNNLQEIMWQWKLILLQQTNIASYPGSWYRPSPTQIQTAMKMQAKCIQVRRLKWLLLTRIKGFDWLIKTLIHTRPINWRSSSFLLPWLKSWKGYSQSRQTPAVSLQSPYLTSWWCVCGIQCICQPALWGKRAAVLYKHYLHHTFRRLTHPEEAGWTG